MTYFDKSRDLALEFLSQVIFAGVLSSVQELQPLHCDIILFISCLKNVRASTCTNLLPISNVLKVYAEVFLGFLELLTQNVCCLLCLRFRCHDMRVCKIVLLGVDLSFGLFLFLLHFFFFPLETLVLLTKLLILFMLIHHEGTSTQLHVIELLFLTFHL